MYFTLTPSVLRRPSALISCLVVIISSFFTSLHFSLFWDLLRLLLHLLVAPHHLLLLPSSSRIWCFHCAVRFSLIHLLCRLHFSGHPFFASRSGFAADHPYTAPLIKPPIVSPGQFSSNVTFSLKKCYQAV